MYTILYIIYNFIFFSKLNVILRGIPLLTPLIDPNWINSELTIALVKIF